jgi:hypothetical protein
MSIEDMKNDFLWIFSDDKKWCVSRTSLIEMFDGTPICLSIIGFVTTEKSINDYDYSYRFLHISPKYIKIFIELLRKERTIFIDSGNLLPKIHYEFFGIDIIKTNIIKGFFSNIENIILDEISLDGKETLREMNYTKENLVFDLLGKNLSLIDLFNSINIHILLNSEREYFTFNYSDTNENINLLIKLLILIYGLNEIFSHKNVSEKFVNRTKNDYKSRKSFCIIDRDFKNLKQNFSDCKRVEPIVLEECGCRDLYYDIDNLYPYLSKQQMIYMNILSELFEDSITIDYNYWYHNSRNYRNDSFENYNNITGDNFVERRKLYIEKIRNIINEFSNFYLILEKLEEKYKEYLSNF